MFASVDALANTSSGIDPVEACQLVTTVSSPYDTLNTATGSAAWVSFPGEGTVRRYQPDRTVDPVFNLQTVPDLCPTRLSLSPDETKLVVLDDPSDPNGCNNPARGSRVAVFNATTGALLTDGVLTVATPGDRGSGQVAANLDNTSLVVLEPFAGSYRLERYFFCGFEGNTVALRFARGDRQLRVERGRGSSRHGFRGVGGWVQSENRDDSPQGSRYDRGGHRAVRGGHRGGGKGGRGAASRHIKRCRQSHRQRPQR
ncbi:MAG: hypothetical protein HC933_21890 [Pleurocapsa sp. SU_196_0]|nr:hypothetical protein [Pleurocapsa sp. SU_196_0]